MDIIFVFNSYVQDLKPLFRIDPLLLRLFVKVISFEDVQLLIGKVPTSVLLMRLAEECAHGYQVMQYMNYDMYCCKLASYL